MATFVYNAQLDVFTLYNIHQEEEVERRRPSVGPALPALGHATSGAAGSAISKLLIYPLDLVITRLQVQNQFKSTDKDDDTYTGLVDAVQKIYEHEGGITAFYSGIGPEILKSVADSFLFFLAYTYIRQKRLLSRGSTRSLSALDEIGVGVVAGAISKFFTTPIQNIVTRKQTASMLAARSSQSLPPPNLSAKDIALQIRDEKGIQGFWSGYSASLILTLNPSITMLLHKVLLRFLVPRSRHSDPGAGLTFILAALSKAMASTVTYPFSLAKARAQVSSQKPTQTTGPTSADEKKETLEHSKAVRARQHTVFSTILKIARTEGLAGLYQGLGAEVVKGFFSHGITMLMKDQIHTLIISLYYALLRTLDKYPSGEELAEMASKRAKDTYQSAKDMASNASQQVQDSLDINGNKNS